MNIQEAQHELRGVFVGGAVGQTVSGVIWLFSAALGTWVSPRWGILALALGGTAIFPLTQLALRLLGRRASLRRENPFNQLAMQVAFIVPLCLPLVGAAALYRLNWFYPAFLLVVGAHYLPFMFLYGMPAYGALAAALIGAGLACGLVQGVPFSTGGWLGGGLLLAFAALAWRLWAREPTAAAPGGAGKNAPRY